MVRSKCDMTEEGLSMDEEPVWQAWTLHHFGLMFSAFFTLIAVFTSSYLMFRHATHYLKPWQQRHIIRLLFMVPVYSTVSFLSYAKYRRATYIEIWRDCYEPVAVASFFALLCSYIAADLHSQKDYFRSLQPKGWLWPLNWFGKCCRGENGICRTPRSGLTWFNIVGIGVFQYCVIKSFMTLVAVFTQATGRYCIESMHPAFANFWVMLIESVSATIAMYCLIQFYTQLKDDFAEHKTLLKLTAVKLVVFLSFWQTLVISILTSRGYVKPSPRFAAPNIRVGIPSFLLCIEMAISSFFHLWAFPWRVYDVRQSRNAASEPAPGLFPEPAPSYSGGWLGIKAFVDAFGPWDLVKNIGRGFKWCFVGRRIWEQDVSYTNSARAIGLEPLRRIFTVQTPLHSDNPLNHINLSSINDDSHLHTDRSSPNIPSLVNEEEEVAEEENNLLSDTQSASQISPSVRPPQDDHKIFQNSSQAFTNISTTSVHLDSTSHPGDSGSHTGTPQNTQAKSQTLDSGLQEEDTRDTTAST